LVITLIAASGTDVVAARSIAVAPYTFNFEGNPPAPQAWNPSSWDVVVNSRDTDTFGELEGMEAQHGADCSAPPATHFNSSYAGAVFICKNHLMTAISAGGYGEIVLTPNHMVDISTGAAQVSFSVSTDRASFRDWWDVWLTPFADNLVLPIGEGFKDVDLNGPPKNAIHIELSHTDGSNIRSEQYSNFKSTPIESDWWTSIESLLTPSATTRSQFAIELSATHLRFGMPSLPSGRSFSFIDSDLPSRLTATQYVVQLAHHSYNPTKDCDAGHCGPNTWHWSNFAISKAVPFTLDRGDSQVVNSTTTPVVNFPAPAPAGAFLRFAANSLIDVSLDGGKTWTAASRQAQSVDAPGRMATYWTPVPVGTKRVTIRGQDWWAGPWWVRDISIWSAGPPAARAAPEEGASNPPAAAPEAAPTQPAQAPPVVRPPKAHSPRTVAETVAQGVLTAARNPGPIGGAGLMLISLLAGLGLGYVLFGRGRRIRRRRR